jgi:hypothetical protein
VDNAGWNLGDVEGVEHDGSLFAIGVKVLGPLRQRRRDLDLVFKVNSNVRMTGSVGRVVLEETMLKVGHDVEGS